MSFDYAVFDAINGLAGQVAWLDALGRFFAVYGAFVVLALALGALWWPRLSPQTRQRLAILLAVTAACCTLAFLVEWFLTTQVLHRELRARPANARWATLLLTEESGDAFPAWPVVFAVAGGIPLMAVGKRLGTIALCLAVLAGLALVFAGVNYPFDVLTGIFLGAALGYTAVVCCGRHVRSRHTVLVWGALIVWGALMAVTIRPVHGRTGEKTTTAQLQVQTPAAVLDAFHVVAPGEVRMRAATNGQLHVASLQVILTDPEMSLPMIEDGTRRISNTAFGLWPELDVLTVEIAEKSRAKISTLYTVTVERAQWPATGYGPEQALPGKKFYNPRFYAPR